MTSFPDPDQGGTYQFRAPNKQGHVTGYGIDINGNSVINLANVDGASFFVRKASGATIFSVDDQGNYTDRNPAAIDQVVQSQPGPPTPTVFDWDFLTYFDQTGRRSAVAVCRMDQNSVDLILPHQNSASPLFLYVIRDVANANVLRVLPNTTFGAQTINGAPFVTLAGTQQTVLFLGSTQLFSGAFPMWTALDLPLL